jgi:RNA polymerase sigma-70 factor (ECF subfamily)
MAPFVDMPSTIWALVGRARAGNPEELDGLLRKYRPPVLSFVRSSVRDPEEAEDITQEVFVTLVQDEVLSKADPAKGKFRSLLLAVARHVISGRRRSETALRRGGGRRPVSLDAGRAESTRLRIEGLIAAPAEDESFDALWVDNLVRLAMNRLREDHARYFDALFSHANHGLGYEEIGRRLGISVTDVKNYLHQARLRLRRFILQEIQAYSHSRGECEAELAYLRKFLE